MCADITTECENRCEVYLNNLDTKSALIFIHSISQQVHLIPIIIRKLRAGMSPLNPRAINQDMDFMSILQNSRCKGRNLLLRRQIRCINDRFPANSFDGFQGCGLGSITLYISISFWD